MRQQQWSQVSTIAVMMIRTTYQSMAMLLPHPYTKDGPVGKKRTILLPLGRLMSLYMYALIARPKDTKSLLLRGRCSMLIVHQHRRHQQTETPCGALCARPMNTFPPMRCRNMSAYTVALGSRESRSIYYPHLNWMSMASGIERWTASTPLNPMYLTCDHGGRAVMIQAHTDTGA